MSPPIFSKIVDQPLERYIVDLALLSNLEPDGIQECVFAILAGGAESPGCTKKLSDLVGLKNKRESAVSYDSVFVEIIQLERLQRSCRVRSFLLSCTLF